MDILSLPDGKDLQTHISITKDPTNMHIKVIIDLVLYQKKIQELDVSATFYKLLESYFCNRYKGAKIDDALSESSKFEEKYTRGSFPGLFFFVLFIDILPIDIVYFSSYLFTDDLFLLYTGSNNPANRLKPELCQVQTRSGCNGIFQC